MAQRALLRKQLRANRKALTTEQQKSASHELCQRLSQHQQLQQAQTIALYLANDGEIDLSPFLAYCWQQGKKICLPVLHPVVDSSLLFLHYQAETPLLHNSYGIPEPALNVQNVVPIAEIDAILLPLVGFDAHANRLGMGGGYYDRTLAQWHQQRHPMTTLIGVAHECQRVPQLPIASWDVPLDKVMTPKRSYSSHTKNNYTQVT